MKSFRWTPLFFALGACAAPVGFDGAEAPVIGPEVRLPIPTDLTRVAPEDLVWGSHVRIRCSATTCLVAWEEHGLRGGSTVPTVYGYGARLRASDLALLDAQPILIATDVEAFGVSFAVLGDDFFLSPGVRVRGSDGAVSAAPWLVGSSGFSAGGGHLVVVDEFITFGVIYQTVTVTAQRFTADGTALDATPIAVTDATGFSIGFTPAVASNGSTHLVLWYESFSSFLCGLDDLGICFDHEAIAGQRVGTNGQLVDAEKFELYDDAYDGVGAFEAGGGGFAFTTKVEDADGDSYQAAYALGADGRILGEVAVPRPSLYDSDSALAFDGSRFVMVWKEDPTDYVPNQPGQHILKLVRFTPAGDVIDGEPVVVEETTGGNGVYDVFDPGITGLGGGRSLLGYTRRDTEDSPWYVSVQTLITTPGTGGGSGGTLPGPTPVPPPVSSCSAGGSAAGGPLSTSVLVLAACALLAMRARRRRA